MRGNADMKGRNYNLELIRTISFVLVIVIHVTNYYCRAYGDITNGEYIFAVILDGLARVSVPGFFMITGALLLGRQEPVRKAADRCIRFLVVLIFWSLVYYIFNVYFMHTPCRFLDMLYFPVEMHLWYLYAIIPIYAVMPFFQIMCKGMDQKMDCIFLALISIAVAGMYLMSFFKAEPYYDLPLIGDKSYAFYVFLGYFLYKYRNQIYGGTKMLAGIFIGSNLINITATILMTRIRGDHFERFFEYGCPLTILSGASFFLLMIRLKDGKIELKEKSRKQIDMWSSCSFGIYLVHILFLDSFKKYVSPEMFSAYWIIPVLVAALLLFSFCSVRVIRLFPGGKQIT